MSSLYAKRARGIGENYKVERKDQTRIFIAFTENEMNENQKTFKINRN